MSKKEDQARLDAIGNIPCVCCYSLGLQRFQPSRTERHHLVDMGNRELSGGHQATVALCGWHHRAQCYFGWSLRSMYEKYGPSMKYQGPPEELEENKGRFELVFGDQRELLGLTDKLLDTVSGHD